MCCQQVLFIHSNRRGADLRLCCHRTDFNQKKVFIEAFREGLLQLLTSNNFISSCARTSEEDIECGSSGSNSIVYGKWRKRRQWRKEETVEEAVLSDGCVGWKSRSSVWTPRYSACSQTWAHRPRHSTDFLLFFRVSWSGEAQGSAQGFLQLLYLKKKKNFPSFPNSP